MHDKDEQMMKNIMLRKGQKLNATILHNLQVVEVIINTKTLTDDLDQPGSLSFGLSKRVGDRHSCRRVRAIFQAGCAKVLLLYEHYMLGTLVLAS